MKAYLLSLPQQLARLSHEIDAKAILANKSWTVFNDEGVKQVFIFQPDGKLIISTSGKVFYSTWSYLDANRSIIIENGNDVRMFHPAFSDDVLLVLQQDGTQESVVMIDEANAASFAPKTLQELKEYFIAKELAYIEAKKAERIRIYGPTAEDLAEEDRKKKEDSERIIPILRKVVSDNFDDFDAVVRKRQVLKRTSFFLALFGLFSLIISGLIELYSVEFGILMAFLCTLLPLLASLFIIVIIVLSDGITYEMTMLALEILRQKDSSTDYDSLKEVIGTNIVDVYDKTSESKESKSIL